jgi:hypothetical protein
LVWRTNKMGLEINGNKTKCMILSWEPYNKNEYLKLGIYNFEIVKVYTYLGTVWTHKYELLSKTEKELRMAVERIMNFFCYIDNQAEQRNNKWSDAQQCKISPDRPCSQPTQPPIQWAKRSPLPWVKRPVREDDH